jgi:hypothetical protein
VIRLFAAASVAAVIGATAFIGCQKKNEPPDIASVPSGSSVGSVDTTYRFSSTTADPDGDSVAIRFDWGDGDTSGWSDWAAGGDSISMSHSWSDSGVFHVKAQARDKVDAASDWSAGHQIGISAGGQNEPPKAPSAPSGPDTGSVGTEYAFVSTAADPDGDSVAIRFDWGDGDTSEWSFWTASGESVSTTHSWSGPGSYSTRAQTKDTRYATSYWSNAHQIVISGGGSGGWERTYGGEEDDVAYSVCPTADGGYAIVGYTTSFGAGDTDVYLIRVDSLGTQQWDRQIGGQYADHGSSIVQTADGGYAIGGSTKSWQNVGDEKVLIVKTDPDGDTVWTRREGGSNGRLDGAYSIQQTHGDGGYILVGRTEWPAQLYLLKRHPDGQAHWSKSLGWDDSNEIGFSVQQTSDGGYVAVGTTDHHGRGHDVYLCKTSGNGDVEFCSTYCRGAGQQYDDGLSVRQTSDGGYIIAGFTASGGAGGQDVYLIKTNPDGSKEWDRVYGGQYDDQGRSVVETPDGGYLIAGYTYSFGAGGSDVYLIRTDANGDTLWTRTFGGQNGECAYEIRRHYQSYIIAGYTSSSGAGKRDVYLIKVDANGNVE